MSDTGSERRRVPIAIIGAGPGGICMGIKLKQAGFDDFVILERSDGVGGTWRSNRYPGCACDVPTHVYQFSFELNGAWSRPYATQPEILAYMERCAEKYGLLPHCRFGTSVTRASWQEDRACWALELAGGEILEAHAVVSAVGMFNELIWPDIPGLASFAGTMFHSARWDWDHDLTGETVGVIGSAASSVQLVPEIVKHAGQVYLFQRTANWVLPKADAPYSAEELDRFLNDPSARQAARDEVFTTQESNNVAKCRRRRPGDPGRDRPGRHGGRERPGRPLQASAEPSVGMQATVALQRVLSRVQPTQSRTGHRIDRPHHRRVDRDRGGAERRVDTIIPGHRLRRHQVCLGDRCGRPGRDEDLHGLGGRGPGLPGSHARPVFRICSCSTGPTPTTARSSP